MKPKPDVPTEGVKARSISLAVGSLELVESEAESIYLPVLANPGGVQVRHDGAIACYCYFCCHCCC